MSLELKLSLTNINCMKKLAFLVKVDCIITGKTGLIFKQFSTWNYLIVNTYSVTLLVFAVSS